MFEQPVSKLLARCVTITGQCLFLCPSIKQDLPMSKQRPISKRQQFYFEHGYYPSAQRKVGLVILMALINFGLGVAEIRNKEGGTVFSRNRGGAYVRKNTAPLQPNTSFQQTMKTRLSDNAQAWRGLTPSQQAAWRASATDFPYTDVFGYSRTLSGFGLYCQLNGNLLNVGAPVLTSPPVPAAITQILTFTFVIDDSSNTFILTWTPTPIPVGYTWQVWATRPLGNGQYFFKNEFRLLTTLPAGTASGADINTVYAARFGAPVTGQRIAVKMIPVLLSTGQLGQPFQFDALVVA